MCALRFRSFFRFAACPTTMLRMDLMERHYDMLKRGGITVICVFNSLPDMINNFASETSAVVALSDREKKASTAWAHTLLDAAKVAELAEAALNELAETGDVEAEAGEWRERAMDLQAQQAGGKGASTPSDAAAPSARHCASCSA